MQVEAKKVKKKVYFGDLDEEEETPPIITKIVKEKDPSKIQIEINIEKEKSIKIEEDPVPQKDLKVTLNRKDIKFSQDLRKVLLDIPRVVLNRRYKKLQDLIEGDSDYYAEEQIRFREPVIYFLYVGRYIRENNDPKTTMADILTEQLQINDWKEEFGKKIKEEGYAEDIDLDEEIEITQDELEENIDEMMRFLHDRFVAGLDKHANYDEIDNDEKLDDIKLINQDNEDHYFEDEEEASENNQDSGYTGIQDF